MSIISVFGDRKSCAFLVWISIWARNLVSATSYLCCPILYLHILPRLAVSSNANCHHRVPCDGTESVFHMKIMIHPLLSDVFGWLYDSRGSQRTIRFLKRRACHAWNSYISYSIYAYTASHNKIPDSRTHSHFHHCWRGIMRIFRYFLFLPARYFAFPHTTATIFPCLHVSPHRISILDMQPHVFVMQHDPHVAWA